MVWKSIHPVSQRINYFFLVICCLLSWLRPPMLLWRNALDSQAIQIRTTLCSDFLHDRDKRFSFKHFFVWLCLHLQWKKPDPDLWLWKDRKSSVTVNMLAQQHIAACAGKLCGLKFSIFRLYLLAFATMEPGSTVLAAPLSNSLSPVSQGQEAAAHVQGVWNGPVSF